MSRAFVIASLNVALALVLASSYSLCARVLASLKAFLAVDRASFFDTIHLTSFADLRLAGETVEEVSARDSFANL